MWVRGLKQSLGDTKGKIAGVAPRVGAWIETGKSTNYVYSKGVAPRVGAWIETQTRIVKDLYDVVAPRVGAWIETRLLSLHNQCSKGRTPCGCVD